MMKRFIAIIFVVMVALVIVAPTLAAPDEQTGATGVVVNAYYLNVRSAPDPVSGSIMAVVSRGQTFNVAGRNSDSSWWLIQLGDGRSGWVNAHYLSVNNAHLVPLVQNNQTPPSGATGTVINAYALNVRSGPSINGAVIDIITRGQWFNVQGRNSDSSWWLIQLSSGGSGWVSGHYFSVTNPQLVPVVGNTGPTGGSYNGTVTADQLNVRTAPDPVDGAVITRVYEGQTYSIIGRNHTGHWWQIRLPDGRTGWVSGAYFRTPAGATNVPVTNTDYVQGTVTAYYLNLRDTPNPFYGRILGQISRGQTYRVIGRNADASWYQLRLPTGLTGWVNAHYLQISDPGRVPITG